MRRRRGPARAPHGTAAGGYTADIYRIWQAWFAPSIPDITRIPTKNRPNGPPPPKSYRRHIPVGAPGIQMAMDYSDGLGPRRPEYDAAWAMRRETMAPGGFHTGELRRNVLLRPVGALSVDANRRVLAKWRRCARFGGAPRLSAAAPPDRAFIRRGGAGRAAPLGRGFRKRSAARRIGSRAPAATGARVSAAPRSDAPPRRAFFRRGGVQI